MLFYPKKIVYLVVFLMFSVATVSAEVKNVTSPNIVINLPSRMLELYSGNTFIKEYPIAIGKPATPTPMGQFNIIDMEKNPTWVPPGRDFVVLSGPDNPLGYRWMGFFELYGIHGTNQPASIGSSASNGCIRVLEENVEEIFEVVKKGTPVKITYERINLKIDSRGRSTMVIYPDVYGIKPLSIWGVNAKLAEVGLKGLVNDAILTKAVQEANGQRMFIAKVHNIKVDGKLLAERAVTINDDQYAPAWAIAKVFASNIIWDEKTQTIWKGKASASGLLKGDILYINAESIKKLFDEDVFFDEIENCLEINL